VAMRVSVVLTVLNEAASLPALLDSLAAQTRPPDEVVVCDGGSTDGTPSLLEAERRVPLRLGKPLPLIPFVFHGPRHALPDVDKLPLTDIIAVLRRHGYLVRTFRLEDSVQVLGINNRIELAAADRILREAKLREVMLAGVTVERPETVTIDRRVRIGIDTLIEPFAQILGETSIGENCRIGAGAIVRDSRLGDGVEIGPYTIVNQSVLEDGSRAGPFARLRLDNHIEAGAAVGNFVEMKKTRLGRRSKALHLAYLGDALIEEQVNIGAGTITCNYDGVSKHRTIIRPGVFVGSNATLVAPLELGEDCYVAAGSVITDPVPADALALGRARQVVKEGWARRRRERMRAADAEQSGPTPGSAAAPASAPETPRSG